MSLILFTITFVVTSYNLIKLAKSILQNNQYYTNIKSIESNNMLEAKRKRLKRKNSKFWEDNYEAIK